MRFDKPILLGLSGGTFNETFLSSSVLLAGINLGRTKVTMERLTVFCSFCTVNLIIWINDILNLSIDFELGFSMVARKSIFSPGMKPPLLKINS